MSGDHDFLTDQRIAVLPHLEAVEKFRRFGTVRLADKDFVVTHGIFGIAFAEEVRRQFEFIACIFKRIPDIHAAFHEIALSVIGAHDLILKNLRRVDRGKVIGSGSGFVSAGTKGQNKRTDQHRHELG